MTNSAIASATSSFLFNSTSVRAITKGDNIWFVAKDVCKALGITWSGATLKEMPKGWQGMLRFNTPSGNQQVRCISEPAVYKLAFRSNKPEADAFTNWVVSEVLPSIRKTGKFEATPPPAPKPTRRTVKALPPAQPFIPEKGREVMERMLALRGTLYRVSAEMNDIMGAPFWDTVRSPCPDHFKPFAKAMHSATWAFVMSVNKELETAALLFEAFVEAEKVLRA